jgi:hypothetical protein
MDDRRIEGAALRLGARAGDAVDVERLSDAVLARLKQAGDVGRPRPVTRWMAMAAGLAIVAGAAYYTFGVGDTHAPPLSGSAPPQLAGLNTAELSEILDSLTVEPPATLSGQATLEDLNAEQLAELLQLMEG